MWPRVTRCNGDVGLLGDVSRLGGIGGAVDSLAAGYAGVEQVRLSTPMGEAGVGILVLDNGAT